MNPTVWTIWSLPVYCLLFSATVLSMLIWRSRQRKERPPVKFQLLRGPGDRSEFQEPAISRAR